MIEEAADRARGERRARGRPGVASRAGRLASWSTSSATAELDLRRYELQRGGVVRPSSRRSSTCSSLLVRERDRVVTKEELLDTVWGDRFVSESALTSRIKAARQAIGDDGKAQRSCGRSTAAGTSSSPT